MDNGLNSEEKQDSKLKLLWRRFEEEEEEEKEVSERGWKVEEDRIWSWLKGLGIKGEDGDHQIDRIRKISENSNQIKNNRSIDQLKNPWKSNWKVR